MLGSLFACGRVFVYILSANVNIAAENLRSFVRYGKFFKRNLVESRRVRSGAGVNRYLFIDTAHHFGMTRAAYSGIVKLRVYICDFTVVYRKSIRIVEQIVRRNGNALAHIQTDVKSNRTARRVYLSIGNGIFYFTYRYFTAGIVVLFGFVRIAARVSGGNRFAVYLYRNANVALRAVRVANAHVKAHVLPRSPLFESNFNSVEHNQRTCVVTRKRNYFFLQKVVNLFFRQIEQYARFCIERNSFYRVKFFETVFYIYVIRILGIVAVFVKQNKVRRFIA